MTEPNPGSAPEGPLVTFTLLAYNQEEYIREAVEGAFSQTYQPLEIILSDDCSSDRTFEIMQQMAAAYEGPHQVRVRKTSTNLKPYSHVLDAARLASGRLMILAAGDDISKPERAGKIVQAWIETGAWAIHSKYDIIDGEGRILAHEQRSQSLLSQACELRAYFFPEDGPVEIVHGATSAYDVRVFQWAPISPNGILSEDGVLTVIVNALRRHVSFVDTSLIKYRIHSEAITNVKRAYSSIDDAVRAIERDAIYSKNIVDRARIILKFYSVHRDKIRRINKRKIQEDIAIHRAKFEWGRLSYVERVASIAIAVKNKRPGFLLPVVIGKKFCAIYMNRANYRRSFKNILGI